MFDNTCTKEEALDFINRLDKKNYLGVIGDVHFIQMNTVDYEELYEMCFSISQNELITVAYVYQMMFDNTMTSDEVDALKGKGVIYIQYIPDGKEAEINKFIKYASNIEGSKYLGLYGSSVFIQFKNENDDELKKYVAVYHIPMMGIYLLTY